MGAEYNACAEAVLGELLSLVKRVPDLMGFKYQDGTPFANALTTDWIQTELSNLGNGSGVKSENQV